MRVSILSRLFACLLACTAASAAYSQEAPKQSGSEVRAPAEDDIVVSGRLGEESLKNPLPGTIGQASREASVDSYQFVRCLNGVSPNIQRDIVEGHVRDPKTHEALDRLIQSHVPCYPRFVRPIMTTTDGYFGNCNPIQAGLRTGQSNPEASMHSLAAAPQMDMKLCRAPYDRGAIIEDAFRTYAPHFMLRRADTLNRATVDRFRAREEVRGKHRSPMDRRYYDTVSCMVQLEPENAIRLLRTAPASNRETELRMLILDRTGYCTGNAKNVRVDPPQFRGYLADAVYHWTIAAKNIETLIPNN